MRPTRARLVLLLLGMALLAAGCAPASATPRATPSPAQASPSLEAVSPTPPLPPTPRPQPYPPYPWPPTATPIPTRGVAKHLSPTEVPLFVPTATPAPPPILLGAEGLPPEQRAEYVSTVFTIPVGTGDGQIGYETPGCCGAGGWASRYTVDELGGVYIADRINRRVVQFSPQGQFIRSVSYSGTVAEAWDITANAVGEVCLLSLTSEDRIRCFNAQGQLVREYNQPRWLGGHTVPMVLDGEGTLWVQGHATLPNAPQIEWDPYPWIVVPLGDRHGVFSEEQRQARAVLGRLAPSGKAYIAWSAPDSGATYLYNQRGERIFELPPHETLADIDAAGNIFTVGQGGTEVTHTIFVREYSPRGLLVAEVTVAATRYPNVQVRCGAVYNLVFDPEHPTAYEFIRWEKR